MPKPSSRTVHSVMRALARAIDDMELPAVEKISQESQEDPFEVLVATMLSAQTRDAVTAAAGLRIPGVPATGPAERPTQGESGTATDRPDAVATAVATVRGWGGR